MIYEILGGTQRERILVEEALWFAKDKLIPRVTTLEVNVRIQKFVLEGSCLQRDRREYDIDIMRGMAEEDLITTVFHEMVHVKQYVRDEIIDCDWDLPYAERPFEIEAYKLQEELLLEFRNV